MPADRRPVVHRALALRAAEAERKGPSRLRRGAATFTLRGRVAARSNTMPDTPAQPHFRLGRELGAGTSGRVFHAVLTQGFGPYPAGFALAVKYQHAELEAEPRARAAFDAESTAGRAVLHPGIVHVIHSGRDERGRFLVMPFVPGRNLREVAQDSGTLPEPLLRSIARQISGGLAALHAPPQRKSSRCSVRSAKPIGFPAGNIASSIPTPV